MSPPEETQHTISMPNLSDSHFSTMAPVATLAIVSRADDLPPPLEALIPYFI